MDNIVTATVFTVLGGVLGLLFMLLGIYIVPKIVDKLTPNGKIPQGDIMSQGMDLLKGILK